MAQFISYKDGIEGYVDLITAYYNSQTRGKEKRMELFAKHGIDMNKSKVYSLQAILDYFKDISEVLGDMNVFLIGRASAFEMTFKDTSKIQNFKDVIELANIAYHSIYTLNGQPMYNEKTNEFLDGIGSYKVGSFDAKKKEMTIVCDNPFPPKSDEGFITGLFERFKEQAKMKSFSIKVDATKERRDLGADSCTFIVNWQ